MPDQSNLGGATVSLNYLVEYLKKQQFSYQLLDTQRFKNPLKWLLNPIYILTLFLLKMPFSDVVFVNVSQGGTKTVAPILYILSKIFGKKFVFRPFGGAMQDHFEKYANWQKWLFEKTLLQSDILFLQTQELVNYFAKKGKHVLQLPTSRNQPPNEFLRPNRPFQKRFVFLGHVNEYKGLDYISEAIEALDSSYVIDIYGPIHEEKYQTIFEKIDNYKGVLSKEEVLPTLRKYDVLILPTFYRGEGYPGAIIEAYSIGLPVISTRWRAIPEIVEDGKTGRLISIKSTEELVGAILSFKEDNYFEFSENAREYFCEHFETEVMTGRAIENMESVFLKKGFDEKQEKMMHEYPIFKSKKRNILLSVLIGLVINCLNVLFVAWLVPHFISANVGIVIFGILLLCTFYIFEKYHAHHVKEGKLLITQDWVSIEKGKGLTKYRFEEIEEINCYYYYSRNRFGSIHELQNIIDLNIRTKNSTIDILCPVKPQKTNLITILKTLPIQLNLISKRRK